MTDPDRPCSHDETEASVSVIHLDDGRMASRVAEVRISCLVCGAPFLFAESIPRGIDLAGVATSLDRQELRVAIESSLDVPRSLRQ